MRIKSKVWDKFGESKFEITRKYQLSGYCLVPPERRGDRISQQAELWITLQITVTDNGYKDGRGS